MPGKIWVQAWTNNLRPHDFADTFRSKSEDAWLCSGAGARGRKIRLQQLVVSDQFTHWTSHNPHHITRHGNAQEVLPVNPSFNCDIRNKASAPSLPYSSSAAPSLTRAENAGLSQNRSRLLHSCRRNPSKVRSLCPFLL